ncbi:MAG: M20/M25/M40 family metallo-hydrolase [Candidatus Cloacimonetes bacterium]|nr:M20/M25/M40 family metallo-hydrolase [Candidatus Cloacimonadota bacterium]
MAWEIVPYFCELVLLDSESRDERRMADRILQDLKALGAEVFEDDCAISNQGNAGNIFACFPGKVEKAPLLFCAHLDTVVPGRGVKPVVSATRISSDGSTVLGSDDKSGVAQIILGIKAILDSKEEHAPIEVLFTVSEEIGLLGTKHFDSSRIKSALGYALDTQDIGEIVCGAPSQNSITIKITGKEAHAGVEPEKGINAIRVASEAIAAMPLGRIDFETTANMGVIQGGIATNIVPKEVFIKGEARSHNPQKLEQICKSISTAVGKAVEKHTVGNDKATCEIKIHPEYKSFFIPESSPAIVLAARAMQKLGITPDIRKGGGGSDANILNKEDCPIVILGTGMQRYHTVHEYIEIADLEKGKALVSEIIRQYSRD